MIRPIAINILFLSILGCSFSDSIKGEAGNNKLDSDLSSSGTEVLRSERVFDDIEFSASLIPPEYRTQLVVDRANEPGFAEELSAQKKIHAFKLRIQRPDGQAVYDYPHYVFSSQADKIKYFGDILPRRSLLVNGADTLSPVLYTLEQTSNLTPYVDLNIAFENLHPIGDHDHIIIEDEYFGKGRIKLKVN